MHPYSSWFGVPKCNLESCKLPLDSLSRGGTDRHYTWAKAMLQSRPKSLWKTVERKHVQLYLNQPFMIASDYNNFECYNFTQRFKPLRTPTASCNTSSWLISILIAETLLLWLLSAMNSTGLLRKDSSHSLSPSASSLCSLWEDRKTLSHHFFLPSSFLPLFLFPLPPLPFSLPFSLLPSFLPPLSLFICTTCTHTHWTTTYSAVLTISSVNLFRGLGKPAHPTRAESDIYSNPSLS